MSSGIPVFDEDGNIILVVVTEYDMTTLNSLQVQLEGTVEFIRKIDFRARTQPA